jgi:cell division septum initiation protein DivIVA
MSLSAVAFASMNPFIFLFTAIAACIFVWGKGKADELTRLKEKFKPVDDAIKYAEEVKSDARKTESEARREAQKNLKSDTTQAESIISDAAKEAKKIKTEVYNLKGTLSQHKHELRIVDDELALRSDEAHLLEVGYYEPAYEFEDIESYKTELDKIRRSQKDMLSIKQSSVDDNRLAAYSTGDIYLDGSKQEGQKLLAKVLKLMLRAFNGECDSFIARVNYKNIWLMEQRINSAFEQINKLATSWKCQISRRYLANRVAELQLAYEYEEKKQEEKEEQARIREQIREEEKVAREAMKAQEEASKEEAKYEVLLQKAEQEAATAGEKDKARLDAKIEELQKRIAEIEEKKRAISQAMLTKTGHVYVISNVGSFGENIYKIGMTRRLEPMDRVKELGDASVPFPFDVHAMIRTSNAPTLENALHKHFESRRLNLENGRKEFFRVSIDEICSELEVLREELQIDSELRLTLLAEAKEFRLSEAKRKHLETSWQASN